MSGQTGELRWHPLLREWVGVAAHRQNRPQMPKDWCPFCPGSGRVPEHYDTWLYPNDFAAFSKDNAPFEDLADADNPGLFCSTGARGSCDVVIYHPGHTMLPSRMPVEHWRKVVDLWRARSAELYADPEVACVFIFENTGEAIGVTMPHPHGQIYAMPFTPPLIEREMNVAREHFESHGECLYCRLLAGELAAKDRIVFETPRFVTFVPFAARFPGEMQIYSREHRGDLNAMDDASLSELAAVISTVRQKYDNLWGFPMPLMMMVRQRPARGDSPYFHFHVEFFPIQRSPTKLKYLAGVESGSGTFLNDTAAEQKAAEFRATEPAIRD
jgi:UDPglucose--hexose-1-phosphate uridylyltransferase